VRSLLRIAVMVVNVVAALSGCRQPLQVSTLQLGRTLNSDNTVGEHTTRFKPDETIYASDLTDQTGASTIAARWSYGGRVVSESEKKVAYKGQAATEFHFQSAGGFPPGDYKVEILIDGKSTTSRDFRVE
jgi:hypothetical protein